jgi:hypothetical protein
MADIFCYEYADILTELLRGAPDGKVYRPNCVYIEFENNSGAEVTLPPLLRDDGKSYYDALLTHPTQDYLRLPLTAVMQENSDAAKFRRGNTLRFFAQTSGVAGVHGKPFSSAAQSRIFGGALVAAPVWSDATQDLVFCRFQYAGDDQPVKTASAQISITREISFE